MIKDQLREKYVALRKKLSIDEVENSSITIANKLLGLPIWDKQYYHIFLSIIERKEIDTQPLLSVLSGKDKHVVLSKSNLKNYTMSHFLLTDSTIIKTNKWGIPEPVDGIEISPDKLDVIFIPLLAFDKLGNRVGYGKGFYDRFLSACKPEAIKIGLSFFEAEDLIEGITENDVKLDFCVTPKTIYKIKPSYLRTYY